MGQGCGFLRLSASARRGLGLLSIGSSEMSRRPKSSTPKAHCNRNLYMASYRHSYDYRSGGDFPACVGK